MIEALRKAGHEVQLTDCCQEALVRVQQREFDCAVLSYSLPNDTIKELIELLRQYRPGCPTIVISENGRIDWELLPTRTIHPRQGAQALFAALADLERRGRRNRPSIFQEEGVEPAKRRRRTDRPFSVLDRLRRSD